MATRMPMTPSSFFFSFFFSSSLFRSKCLPAFFLSLLRTANSHSNLWNMVTTRSTSRTSERYDVRSEWNLVFITTVSHGVRHDPAESFIHGNQTFIRFSPVPVTRARFFLHAWSIPLRRHTCYFLHSSIVIVNIISSTIAKLLNISSLSSYMI